MGKIGVGQRAMRFMTVTLAVNAGRTGKQRRPGCLAPGLAVAFGSKLAICGALFSLAAAGALGCNRSDVPKPRLDAAVQREHAVTIHQPQRLGKVTLGAASSASWAAAVESSSVEPEPRNTAVRCETCHALRPKAVLPASMRELDQFHQGLELQHGELPCASCHTRDAPVTLHLADGRRLPPGRAMDLCRQCHGTQYRDYEHGAHGGMSGHWDLSRGPRLRNHCVDCHDPHAPQIRQVLPSAPPRDRFFGSRSAAAAAAEGGQH